MSILLRWFQRCKNLAKSFRGDEWEYLSIPPGQSEVYNANPVLEKSSMYAENVERLAQDR